MKTLKYISFLVLLTTSASQCKKDKTPEYGPTYVEGVVRDKTTVEGVPYAAVYLQRDTIDWNWGGGGFQPVTSVAADSKGNFHIDYNKENGWSYSLFAERPQYYDSHSDPVWIKQQKGTIILLQPEAYLKVYIKNTQPYDAMDYISVNNSFVSGGGGPFYGIQVDTFVVGKVYGNSTNKAIWFVTKNGISTTNEDSIYCLSFDTTLFILNY